MGYCVGIGNEGGGNLILGVTNKMPRSIVGTSALSNISDVKKKIYARLKMKIQIDEVFDENNNRVVVITILSHPVGKVLKFYDVALMRVDEDLRVMDDERFRQIINESITDFSTEIVRDLSPSDLDPSAIKVLKNKWSQKAGRPDYKDFSDQKTLKSLGLLTKTGLNYTALLLLGKKAVLDEQLPGSEIILNGEAVSKIYIMTLESPGGPPL